MRVALTMMFCFTILFAAASYADALEHANASAGGKFAEADGPGDHKFGNPSAETSINPPVPDVGGSTYKSYAKVDGTTLVAEAHAHQSSDGPFAVSTAQASWTDFLTIENPDLYIALPDTFLAVAYFRPQADGVIKTGQASLTSYLYTINNEPLDSFEIRRAYQDGQSQMRIVQFFQVSHLFDGMNFTLELSVGAGTSDPGESVFADFSHTAYLPPIFIGDANGNPIPALAGLRIVGQSGLHYPVTTVQRVVGDYNGNGVVDAADYVVWRHSVGQTGLTLAADGDGNQVVDDHDFKVWQLNFGNSVGSGAGGNVLSPVPEPASAGMLIFGMLSILNIVRLRNCLAK